MRVRPQPSETARGCLHRNSVGRKAHRPCADGERSRDVVSTMQFARVANALAVKALRAHVLAQSTRAGEVHGYEAANEVANWARRGGS